MNDKGHAAELAKDMLNSYPKRGYCFPIDVFSSPEVAEFRCHFDDFYAYHSEELRVLPANKHGSIYGHTHTFLRWVYRIVSHPKVLDAVEGILGPNLTVRDTAWFVKMPGDKKYISWHQDGTYWGLHPLRPRPHGSRSRKAFQKMGACVSCPVHTNIFNHIKRRMPRTMPFPAARRSQLMWTKSRRWISSYSRARCPCTMSP